jgi:WD40 repeat protein
LFYLTSRAEVHAKLLPLTSATYNSNDARPGCLENTRVALQQQLSEWANDDAPELTTLWLSGMAGTGKSAIATTFSHNMADEGLLGATFFVDRQVAELTDPLRIVQSLAYDLAEGDYNRLSALWSALCAKPTIKDMPLREQVQALIRRPLDSTYSETLVIVIDGLDECTPSDGALLLSTLVDCLAGLPIKLMVSSRNDQDIARRLTSIPHTTIPLQEQALLDVEKDVRLYWEHSLDELCPPRSDTHWRHLVPLDRLVELTGHLFIYATTILKMIQNVKHNRIDKLTQLLRNANPSPEADKRSLLHDLYLRILSQAVNDHDGTVNPESVFWLRNILEVTIFARHPLTRCALSQLLNMEMDELDGYLATLAPVLVIPDTTSANGVVRPLHQSFADFVCQHGGRVHHDLAIDAAIANARLTEHCFARLSKDLHVDMCDIRDPSLFNSDIQDLEARLRECVSSALRYSCSFWAVHYIEHIRSSGSQSKAPLGLLGFCQDHLLHWIELLSLINGLNGMLQVLPTLLATLKVVLVISPQSFRELTRVPSLQEHVYPKSRESRNLGAFLTDALSLMTVYLVPISLSALHVYHSGVVSMPICSLSSQALHHKVGRLVSQRDRQWNARPMIFEGHEGALNSVAFSPNGSQIISGSRDHSVRIWDAVSGSQEQTLNGHTRWISSVAFSPDGSQIISGSGDRTVRVWDAVSGAQKHTLTGHTSWISSVVFSPDGSQIISGSDDHTVRVWDADSGAHKQTLSGHTKRIFSVAFSPNGSQIISGSEDHTVRVWDAVSGAHKHTLSGHTGSVNSTAFSPDGLQIVSGSDDRTVRVWDAISGKHNHTLAGHTDWIRSVAVSPDGLQIISGSDDCTVRVWNAVSGAYRYILTGHTESIRSVAFSSNGSQIVSGSNDCTVRVWNAVMPSVPQSTSAGYADFMTRSDWSDSGQQFRVPAVRSRTSPKTGLWSGPAPVRSDGLQDSEDRTSSLVYGLYTLGTDPKVPDRLRPDQTMFH